MGNFTDIEREFGNLVQKKFEDILNQKNNPQEQQNLINEAINSTLLELRISKMTAVCNITKRNLICYVSAWLQATKGNPENSINDNDMNGFMNAVSGLDRTNGLDLLLYTPGGAVTATESIVSYLRKMFNNDIRVIVPHMAMSAGTMIACASKEIIMGKESSLGPIDPQYRGVPAQGVQKEFDRAIKETLKEPNRALIWREIIQQYRPTFIGECDNAVALAYNLVDGWLKSCMFAEDPGKGKRTKKILNELASHSASKVHDRHYDFTKCKELGLNVTALEDNQKLQDAVLSLHHAYICSFYRLPTSIKFIENQNGQTFIINGQR